MSNDEKTEKASAPAAKKEEVEEPAEGTSEPEPTDIHEALQKAKEVENLEAGEDDPMKDETDAVGDPIVGVTGDMYRPPYVHKADK